MNIRFRQTIQILFLVFAVVFESIAADGPATPPAGDNQEINQLKAQMAEQQRQIQELRAALQEQRKLIEAVHPAVPAETAPAQVPGVRSLGEVASTTPVLPPSAPPPALPAVIAGT